MNNSSVLQFEADFQISVDKEGTVFKFLNLSGCTAFFERVAVVIIAFQLTRCEKRTNYEHLLTGAM